MSVLSALKKEEKQLDKILKSRVGLLEEKLRRVREAIKVYAGGLAITANKKDGRSGAKSAATRKRMAEAQKARWAKVRLHIKKETKKDKAEEK